MNTTEILTTILVAVLSAVATGYATAAITTWKFRRARQNAVYETCKFSLRKTLEEDYRYYSAQGYCSIEDKAEAEMVYKLYHNSFNGNGRGTLYFNNIMALPDVPTSEMAK